MALRVRVMMERLGVKDAEAIKQEIERFDAGHSRAMRAAFNFDWNDALLYHIVLNSARVTVDNCVKTICQLTEHESSEDDSTTKAALAEKLREIKAGEIAVRTDDM
jgi:cytidylate kinase